MPLRLDIKRKFLQRSDRVKCVDIHPTEPWLLTNLYNVRGSTGAPTKRSRAGRAASSQRHSP